MRKASFDSRALGATIAVAFALVAGPATATLAAQDPQQPYSQAAAQYSADQLDSLVAPVALYADPLLAQVLLASTFPDQVTDAAAYIRANGTNGIDNQYWDVSVKAVAHYPTVLNMMDQRIDWTRSLGQAYAVQSSDVMQAVQHMRTLAQAQGNLQTNAQQQVVYQGNDICIWPAQPQYIYVPVYDPAVVYYRPIYWGAGFHSYFSFGIGYPIGAWLIYDWDWPAHRIYYTGWRGGGWIARSRPFISVTNVYVNSGYSHIRYGSGDYRHGGYAHGYVTDPNAHNTGRYAEPRGDRGVMTPGGYRSAQVITTAAHSRTAAPAASAYERPMRPVQGSPVTVRPQVLERPPQSEVRTAAPRGPETYVRSAPRGPEAYVRSAPPRAPEAYVRSEPPRAAVPQAHVRQQAAPAPRESHGSSGGSRSAHGRGHG